MAAATPRSIVGGGGDDDVEGDGGHIVSSGALRGVAWGGGDDDSESYSSDGEGSCEFSECGVSKAGMLRLAQIWVANPSTSHLWTSGIGGVDLYPVIWDVAIHFQDLASLQLKLCSDDIVLSSVVALMETQGYGSTDSVYFDKGIGFDGLEKIDTNAKLQQLKRQHKDAKLLNLSVYRGSAPIFEDVLVTQESQNVVGRQESRNEGREQKGKLKLKQVVEEDSTDASSFDSEGPRDIENDPYFMGV
ncbi:hypothetical protein ZWY2020_033285 [Hordeum vulgare]|nr:hypothetical protein ZWY2020_033285 [Hordeum vulgare]